MRAICISLCLSLFASMVHAGNMPVPDHSLKGEHASLSDVHECHTTTHTKAEKSQGTNHQTHHQCCLGVLANLSSDHYWLFDFSTHFGSEVSPYIYEAFLSHIFKPPRKSST